MTVRGVLFLLLGVILCGPATAGQLSVTVKDAKGALVNDAVVTVQPEAGSAGRRVSFPWPYVMSQQDVQFHPFLLIVPVGTEVKFPNNDKVRHHVYSFSPAKRFQLKLYGRDASRTVVFDKVGTVALGCNIHDRMIAFIDVVDTPWAAKTVDGSGVLTDLPIGPAVMTVWHPFMLGKPLRMSVVIPARGTAAEAVTVELHPPAKLSRMQM